MLTVYGVHVGLDHKIKAPLEEKKKKNIKRKITPLNLNFYFLIFAQHTLLQKITIQTFEFGSFQILLL